MVSRSGRENSTNRWVHNNIEYLPTYGSIQGADMTLQTKRGNSFDTASLLIGLLRAAKIPARYVYGTIQVPADRVMNWVGGVTKPEAALQLMGQGGIPTGGTFTMGDELVASEGLFDPARGWNFADDTKPIAGEYIATHVDLQGVSTAQLQTLQDKLTATQANLQTKQLSGLTKDDLSGDILYSVVLNYFALNQAAANVASRAAGIVEYRRPSFGSFLASAKPLYWFGITKSVSFPGLMMDINRYAFMDVAKDNNPATAIIYNRQSGMRMSAYEHLLPEKTFSDPTDPTHPQAISAVKALALAASQGQKIYTMNQANQAQQQTLLAQITIDPQAMAEIQNALAAGKEVTVHQAPITQSGWTGSGYIITDPGTGAGAYKISGGANGAWYDLIAAGLSGLSDALSEKLRDPNAFNGPSGELSRSYYIKKLAAVAAVAAFVYGITKILTNDKLTPLQQGAQITVLLAFTLAEMAGAAAIGMYFGAPITGVVLGVGLAVLLFYLNEWVNAQIVTLVTI